MHCLFGFRRRNTNKGMASIAASASTKEEIETLRQRAIAKLTQRYGKALVRFILTPEHTTNVLVPVAVQELTTQIQDKSTSLQKMKTFAETAEKLQQFRIDATEVRKVLNAEGKSVGGRGGGLFGRAVAFVTGGKTKKTKDVTKDVTKAVKEAATEVEELEREVKDPDCQAKLEKIKKQLEACATDL